MMSTKEDFELQPAAHKSTLCFTLQPTRSYLNTMKSVNTLLKIPKFLLISCQNQRWYFDTQLKILQFCGGKFQKGSAEFCVAHYFSVEFPNARWTLFCSASAFGFLARLYYRISVAARQKCKNPVEKKRKQKSKGSTAFFERTLVQFFNLSHSPCAQVNDEYSMCVVSS